MYRHATHRRLALLTGAGVLLACSGGEPPAASAPAPRASAPGPVSAPADPSVLLAAADRRELAPELADALGSGSVEARRAASLAIARLHDPAAFDLLARGLRDPDGEVRDHASLGLGALEDRAPDAATAALVGALAAEPDPTARARHLEDLGRLATDEALAALPSALASDHPAERRGACRAVGAAALRGRAIDAALLRRASARVVDDATPAVRLACAYALSRAAAPDEPADADAIGADLSRALGDPDADVRAMAVRALARYPGATPERLAAATRDPDWIVAVHAFRALARRAASGSTPAPAVYAGAVRSALDALLASGDVAAGGPLHVFLVATEAPLSLARDAAVHAAATDALARLGDVPRDRPATRDRGLAHCAAARLVDLGRGWPARVERCGLEQVSDAERRVLAAEVMAQVEGSDAQRGVYLQRLLRDDDARVRQAALAAMGTLGTPEARDAVVRAVRDEADVGARNAALEALRALAARRSERLATAVLAGTPEADDGWPHAAIVAALRASGRALIAADDLEGIVTWLSAARDLAPRELAEQAAPLAAHANLAVRLGAREALLAGGADAPDPATHAAPANPLDAAAIREAPHARAVLETDRGRIVIALWPERAPGTVARFAALVEGGFYDGLAFHRVVPGFVAQGGDPRGDGYGGPGWAQRCEDHRAPYERGTVGMALAGRDTGGSQFFVTLSPQPHLDARYTAFGQVVEGMDVVDQLQAGDAIRRVTLETTADPARDRAEPRRGAGPE